MGGRLGVLMVGKDKKNEINKRGRSLPGLTGSKLWLIKHTGSQQIHNICLFCREHQAPILIRSLIYRLIGQHRKCAPGFPRRVLTIVVCQVECIMSEVFSSQRARRKPHRGRRRFHTHLRTSAALILHLTVLRKNGNNVVCMHIRIYTE